MLNAILGVMLFILFIVVTIALISEAYRYKA